MNYLVKSAYCIVALALCCLAFSYPLFANAQSVVPPIRVVIIGIDGLRGDVVADMHDELPSIQSLIQQGAYTFTAQAQLPTISSPNWASILTGVSPEKHGIYNNKWQKDYQPPQPHCSNTPADTAYQNLFQQWQHYYPSASAACFYHWKLFEALLHSPSPVHQQHAKSTQKIVQLATQYIAAQKTPSLLFLHFNEVDVSGHIWGYGKARYRKALKNVDKSLEKLLSALHDNPMPTIIALVSDHGGIKHNHGGATTQEQTIPFIITGGKIPKNYAIRASIQNKDLLPTLASFLQWTPSDCWEGKPITEIIAP